MNSVLSKVIEWSRTLHKWQQDAIRRLLTVDSLTIQDNDELFGMFLKSRGMNPPKGDTLPEPKGLLVEDVSGGKKSDSKLVFKAIENLQGINALPDGCCLPIGHTGLTVVYGENGAGKSGFARVIKQACRARDRGTVHPNVFSTVQSQTSATFKVNIDGKERKLDWTSGASSPEQLSQIVVFDSKCARIIIDENNEAFFLPYGASVFSELASLQKEFQTKLQTMKRSTDPPLILGIPSNTRIAKFLSSITSQTRFSREHEWSSKKEERLKSIERLLKDDPSRRSEHCQRVGRRLKELMEYLATCAQAVCKEKIQEYKELHSRKNTAQQAMDVSVKEQNSQDYPLGGVGSDTWQMLYKAAKNYSETQYPGRDFPCTEEDGDVCVLCMQPLDDGAKTRFVSFRKFMDQTIRKTLEKETEAQNKAIESLMQATTISRESFSDLDEVINSIDGLTEKLDSYITTVKREAEHLLKCFEEGHFSSPSETDSTVLQELDGISKNFMDKARKIANLSDVSKRQDLQKKYDVRLGIKHIYENISSIRSYIEALDYNERIEACARSLNPAPITSEGKSIITESLGNQIEKALREELEKLGCPIDLEVQKTGQQGAFRFKLTLLGAKQQGAKQKLVPLTEVLSEGEQKVIAIAGFLAELQASENTAPIILDDPVTSLDHRYRERIAQRLSEESTRRQVIVFTHDIPFLLMTQDIAAGFGSGQFGVGKFGGLSFTAISISKQKGQPGHVEKTLPWEAQKPEKRVNMLLTELETIQQLHGTDQSQYNCEIAGLYGKLRETWEGFVEQILFHQVVQRHQKEVKTLQLRYVSITPEITSKVERGMTRASTWMYGHEKSQALDQNRPVPTEVKKDIEELSSLILDVKKLQKDAEESHKQLLTPNSPEIG